jgi:hypothetical protein
MPRRRAAVCDGASARRWESSLRRDALSTIPEIPHPICWQILDIQQVATVGSCHFVTVSVRLNSPFLQNAIALAERDDAGPPVLDLMFGDVGEAHDGEDVTSFSLEGSRAVEDDLALTGIAGQDRGFVLAECCHDRLPTMLDIQTSRFVMTSRRFTSCSISCRPPA